MKIFTRICFLSIALALCLQVNAQQKRYLEPVFDEVQVSDLQAAGTNFTVLSWIFAASQGVQGNTLRQPLVFQTYEPVGDTETERPLILYLHTGNFFPFPQNGSCGGTIADSTNVEIATRLAKMGYVVASCDYRLGWLPTQPEELVRRFSLINAAYRGVQDVNTFIRYFKKTAAVYGIDPEKITVWGQGTGGYLSLASAYLNEYEEIINTSDPTKFQLPTQTGPIPMVIEAYNGDISGKNTFNGNMPTFVDATYNAISSLPIGDTLSVPNHIEDDVNAEFALAVNMGGALGDSTWVNEGEVPLISFHVETDPFAPYRTDVLLVPTATGPQPVVEVSGSYDVQRVLSRTSNNDVFNTIPEGNDPIGDAADSDFNALYTFTTEDSAPWEWTDLEFPGLLATDCNGDKTTSLAAIDTIIQYFAPRACVALGLNCDFNVSTTDLELDNSYVSISPNPAADYIQVTAKKGTLENVTVYGIDGRAVRNYNNITTNELRIERENLESGMYIISSRFEEGVKTSKIMFK